jgi:hypothetical protein
MPLREWVDTGSHVEVPGKVDRIPEYDARGGEHLWIWAVVYRANIARLMDLGHTPFLDGESLLAIDGPGCFYCEKEYTAQRARHRCPGNPPRS